MIVDLMRNDLGRCCEIGSVDVPKLFEVHSFANVHHLISTVTGRLRKDLHVIDLFRACFPGVDQSMETNIAIRTIVVKDGIARYSAGGGLVIDSEVEDEYQDLIYGSCCSKIAFRNGVAR